MYFKFMYVFIIVETCNQELQETMLEAQDTKYSIPIRYVKVLFHGAAAAGKSNFLNLVMKENFQKLHINTEVHKHHLVTIGMKEKISGNDVEVEFKRMQVYNEISQLELFLQIKHNLTTTPLKKFPLQIPSLDNANMPKRYTTSAATLQINLLQTPLQYSADNPPADNSKLALSNVKANTKKLNEKSFGAVWDMLTFMDTGDQPQFIRMLLAVNIFTMITFIVHKMETGGQYSLKKIMKVQYGNEKGEISYKPHSHNTLIFSLLRH